MTTPALTRHMLPGLRPEPLASYLSGLGLIRVLGSRLMLAALTTLEMAVGRSGRARSAVPVRYEPSAGEFLDVFRREESP